MYVDSFLPIERSGPPLRAHDGRRRGGGHSGGSWRGPDQEDEPEEPVDEVTLSQETEDTTEPVTGLPVLGHVAGLAGMGWMAFLLNEK